MENQILDIIKMLSSKKDTAEEPKNEIPKEVLEQYPYGKFPLQYTKSGQESIRKQSENRFQNVDDIKEQPKTNNQMSDISTLLPLLQILGNKKQKGLDSMMPILSKLLFKDNPEMEKLFKLFEKNNKTKEINNTEKFPDTNTVCISALKKIN